MFSKEIDIYILVIHKAPFPLFSGWDHVESRSFTCDEEDREKQKLWAPPES